MKKLILTTSILLLAAACNKQVQVQPVQQSPQKQDQAANQRANWKTYTNSSLGFSVEYPASWNFDSSADVVVFTDSPGGRWMFEVRATSTKETLKEASSVDKKILEYDHGYYATLEQNNINIEGEPAIQNFYKAPNRLYYGDTQTFVMHHGKLYVISEGYGADEQESKMFKTFKFTK